MPARFLQTPSGKHMESSPEHSTAYITELHIQTKLENESITKSGMHISGVLLKDLVLQHISLHTNKLWLYLQKSKL